MVSVCKSGTAAGETTAATKTSSRSYTLPNSSVSHTCCTASHSLALRNSTRALSLSLLHFTRLLPSASHRILLPPWPARASRTLIALATPIIPHPVPLSSLILHHLPSARSLRRLFAPPPPWHLQTTRPYQDASSAVSLVVLPGSTSYTKTTSSPCSRTEAPGARRTSSPYPSGTSTT